MLERGAPHGSGSDTSTPASALEGACRLSTGLLLLVGRFGREAQPLDVTLQRDGVPVTLDSSSMTYELPTAPGAPGEPRTLLMVFLPSRGRSLQRGDSIDLDGRGMEIELDWQELKRSLADLKTLSRTSIAPLSAPDRAQAMQFLAKALAEQPLRGAVKVSEMLSALRSGLREHLPSYVHAPDQPRALAVESIMAVDDSSFYMEGWVRDEEAEIVRLTAVSPEGDRAELADRLYRFTRADVTDYFSVGLESRRDPTEKAGFISFLELASPSFLGTGWILEMENSEGAALEVPCPPVIRDPDGIRKRLLEEPGRDRLPDNDLMENHVMPALMRIQKQVEASVKVESVTEFGEPPASPDVSLIIPLYKRIDLIEQQLAEFVQDPEMKGADIIYVLDSPEQKDELIDLSSRLFPIYRVPMRAAILQRNVGFAGANNAGATIARGRLLVLMNSDVLPDRPGWLSAMSRFYDATPDIGALAPKLLYEDGSIQNAGMRFHRPHGTAVWLDSHYYRGLHRDFPPANVTRKVPLISGACFMIARALYRDLDGLRGIYVQGDYEDSDLCMRLNELGHENWFLPEVEVFHLEATSYSPEERGPANRYNGWLHTHIWKDRIESVMARYESADGAAEPG